MKLATLIESIAPKGVSGPLDLDISGIAYDSRKVERGALFVAMPGLNVDGAAFIKEALARGAVAVVTEQAVDLGTEIAHIEVATAREALATLAGTFYSDPSREMKVVGVTGTNGKTTTAYMVYALLNAAGHRSGLIGTVGYHVGDRVIPATRTTPEAPELYDLLHQMRSAGCDHAVMEVSSHAIALKRVHGIHFHTRAFTNLSQDHLDYHHDMESYFETKGQWLLAGTEDTCGPVICTDDIWGKKLYEQAASRDKTITCGFDETAMVRASDEVCAMSHTEFQLTSPWGAATVRIPYSGRFNIQNALVALSIGGQCGIALNDMVGALETMPPVPGRLEPIKNRRKLKIFVDYAHTAEGLHSVLTTLRDVCKGKLVVVFGCGGDRDIGKRKRMGELASMMADYTIITSDNPRSEDPAAIASAIAEGFSQREQYEIVLDRREAIGQGIARIGRRDILLIAGKGHETRQELNHTVIPFDDREVVREILN